MSSGIAVLLYFILMVIIIVGMDVLFFRDRFVPRLIANIAIVVVFAAVYFIFLRPR